MRKVVDLTSVSRKGRVRMRETLYQQNYYLVVPQDLAVNEFAKEALKAMRLRHADFEKLHLVAAAKVLEIREKWLPVNPNIALLSEGDPQEVRRIEIAASRRKMLIQEGFNQETGFTFQDGSPCIAYQGRAVTNRSFSDEHVALSKLLANHAVIRGLEWDWINQHASSEGGIVVLGSTPQDVESTLFRILTLKIPEDSEHTNSAQLRKFIREQSARLLRKLVTELHAEQQIAAEQEGIQIERASFQWSDNPLITQVRDLARPNITEMCKAFVREGVTEFDLATQLMMHLPTYDAIELWHGDSDLVKRINDLIAQEKGDEANTLFAESLSTGIISLNWDLVSYECLRQGMKLAEYYKNLSIEADCITLRLPATYMGNPEQNPFKSVVRAEIDARKRQIRIDPVTREKTMEVIERHSGRIVIFKKISAQISRLYSLGFSNLHYARDGEIAAFGAFLEGDEYPFAYSSYSPVTRRYTKDMLRHLHLDPATILESTRAWNASWAPENTMSTLFSFSHEMLKEDRVMEMKEDQSKRQLAGIITSINPNLGFKAVSFRGVRFNVAGVKPTQFSYLRNSDGAADFLPKNVIQLALGLSSEEELENDPRYLTNKISFLPTLELLALFDKNKEQELLQRPVYRVSPPAFRKG